MAQPEPSFIAPVPGSGLISEPGSRAYKNPPQYTTVEEVADYYITQLASDEMADEIVNVLDMGVPVTDLANIIQIHSVMEGKHTLDVSMLILPVLMEIIALIGDTADIDYDMGTERKDKERVSNNLVATAKLKMERKLRDQTLEDIGKNTSKKIKDVDAENTIEEEEVEEPAGLGGLMARRS